MNELEKNPWVTKTTELAYESAWIRVTKHDVNNPAGNPAVYSVVHFKNIAIGILPIDEECNTWLVGQFRYPTNEYSWEIPEGGGKHDVNPQESAARELKEEAGIIAQNYNELLRLHLSNSATDELALVYLATHLQFAEAEPEESEVLQVKKIHLNDAFDWVMQGKITDAISVAAILKAKWLMDNKQLFV
ncbi:MAG: NUDIX hydrolase [Bacteroidetes bacterium]|nr:NUDIX hydrolase [Bacteroidota bacterium]